MTDSPPVAAAAATAGNFRRLATAGYAAFGLALVLALAGCGPRGAIDLTLDKELARASLARFLDAWRDGRKSDQLASASPAIFGRDPAWSDGQKLVAYELLGETDGGANLYAKVKLTFGGKQERAGNAGAGASQEVVYVVGTSPKITVFRDE
jgi:hypothetical protein